MLSTKPVAPRNTFRASALGVSAPEGRVAVSAPPAGPMAMSLRLDQQLKIDETSQIRKLAFFAALVLTFIRFGVIPELLYVVTGTNTYLLYVFGPPALLGCLLTGGLRRTFRSRAAVLWSGFFLWMIAATPFSSWVGGSIEKDLSYGRINLIFLFLLGGLATSWKEVRMIFYTIAAAGCVNLVAARFLSRMTSGRLELDLPFDGIISNSNDLAAQLILIIPFVLFVAFQNRQNMVLRIVMLGGVGVGLLAILSTGSRGALVGVAVATGFLLVRLRGAARFALLCALPAVALLLAALSPSAALQRLGTLFGQEAPTVDGYNEADESVEARNSALRKSLEYTFKHPLFGVGPAQFSNYEGTTSRAAGQHGNWHETHNTYTQVSSENGLPAFVFFVGAFVVVWRLVNRTYRQALARNDTEVSQACSYYQMALVGYLVTITFLAMAYSVALPALIGLGGAIYFAAQRRFATQAPA